MTWRAYLTASVSTHPWFDSHFARIASRRSAAAVQQKIIAKRGIPAWKKTNMDQHGLWNTQNIRTLSKLVFGMMGMISVSAQIIPYPFVDMGAQIQSHAVPMEPLWLAINLEIQKLGFLTHVQPRTKNTTWWFTPLNQRFIIIRIQAFFRNSPSYKQDKQGLSN